ncbi:MAG: DNA recombination protein RmuC [Actinomycetota bacterium]
MEILLVLAVVAALGLGLALGWAFRSPQAAPPQPDVDLHRVVDHVIGAIRAEQGEALKATVETVVSVASSTLGDQLAVGKGVIDRERDSVTRQYESVGHELHEVRTLVHSLKAESARQQGALESQLEQTFQATRSLSSTTSSLAEALASPKARGQWGERMAEDVLRAAGFTEDINYRKQKKAVKGGIPDYTFPLPHGHVVHMDVKFPIDNYRRWLEADGDEARRTLARQFQKDVRLRVRELRDRAYIDPEVTVDYVLLFVPNESVYGFLHEHDPDIIDVAIGEKVVLCSPTTLFAVLAVIRQSVDNFLVERRSDEILGALGALREQWEKFQEPMEKMGNALGRAQNAYDELSVKKVRAFEKQLEKLEGFRDEELLDDPSPDDEPDGTAADPEQAAAVTAGEGVEPTPGGQLSLRSVG